MDKLFHVFWKAIHLFMHSPVTSTWHPLRTSMWSMIVFSLILWNYYADLLLILHFCSCAFMHAWSTFLCSSWLLSYFLTLWHSTIILSFIKEKIIRYIINTVLSELSIIMSHQTVFLKKAQKNKDVLFAPTWSTWFEIYKLYNLSCI